MFYKYQFIKYTNNVENIKKNDIPSMDFCVPNLMEHPVYSHSHNNLTNVFFFCTDNRLYDQTNQLRAENLKLSVENEQLRTYSDNSNVNGGASVNSSRIQALEKRLLTQQEELTDLHKRKGENSQMIVDLNIKLEKQTAKLLERDARYKLFN